MSFYSSFANSISTRANSFSPASPFLLKYAHRAVELSSFIVQDEATAESLDFGVIGPTVVTLLIHIKFGSRLFIIRVYT